MYKVFLNDRIIRIGRGENITNNKTTVAFSDDCSPEDIREWFNNFEQGNLNEVVIMNPGPEELFPKFRKAFKCIEAAGGVVVSDERLLFIFRNGKWDLPKGKLGKAESAPAAALREVEEETGIKPGGIDFRLPSTFHIYQSPFADTIGQWILKETFWFQMNYNGNSTGVPQHDEGITHVRWVAKNELEGIMGNTYENLKQIINLYRL